MASTSVGRNEWVRLCYLYRADLSSAVRSPKVSICRTYVGRHTMIRQRSVSSIVGTGKHWLRKKINKGVTKAGVYAKK